MLQTLRITNYALIDSLELELADGFNIITGETGAGKSIMLGAMSLLLGGRSDARVVRDPGRKSVIEAEFSVGDAPRVKTMADNADIDWDDNQLILRREIAPNGRSRAFVNDTPVTVSTLEEISRELIDIHSQHQNQLLQSPDYQREVIDSLADNQVLLSRMAEEYNALRKARKNLDDAVEKIARARNDEDYLRFQLTQIEELRLTPGEQEELEKERDVLANMTDIKTALNAALDALTNDRGNAISRLADAVTQCEELSSVLEEADRLAERLESARVEVQDIAETLADFDASLRADPEELEEIEDRLSSIYSLQHKFKVDSVEALIAIHDKISAQLESIENSDMELDELKAAVSKAENTAMATAREIRARRQKIAGKFAEELRLRAIPLGMKNLRVEIEITDGPLSATGTDKVQFLFAFNKNQPAIPVGNAASGGEISRLMLTIKSIIAGKMRLPTIVFDEVDTGVSGDVANRMGLMMQSIATEIQVIAITHLPQVASKGSAHFKVFKEDDETTTHTRLRRLSDNERIEELAVMLSGSSVDEAALSNARSLLNGK